MTVLNGSSIALDAFGGDHAPAATVEGALEAVRKDGLEVLLVGPSRTIRRHLGRFRSLPSGLEIVEAPEIVEMDESPLVVLRKKKRSSLAICAELVRDGQAAAMVTAGNTGAAWVAAKSILGMIPGVRRPALAAILPKVGGSTLVLDVGANVECRPEHLVQFAVMGSLYAEHVLSVEHPRVGLMSVGEEDEKGGRKGRERYRILSKAGVRFIGNVEGSDVFSPRVDVVVCDGFTGNVILKVAEGLGEMIMGALLHEARQSNLYGAGLLMAKGAFQNLKRRMDYSEYGGAPLLGVNGACLISHGRSTARAIRNALRFAARFAVEGVVGRIGEMAPEVLEINETGA